MESSEILAVSETLEALAASEILASSEILTNEIDDLINTVEKSFAEVTTVVTNMIHKGEALIKHFSDNKQILAELIVKRYDEFIKSSEERKRELLSRLEERELSSETALQLDIEQCQTYLAWLQSQHLVFTVKNNGTKEDICEILKSTLNSLSDIKKASLNLFQVSEIRVDLDRNLDKMIEKCGRVLQLSIPSTECSVVFDTDHYKIRLVTKTVDGELYPYGGLSATAHIGDNISHCIKDNNDGTYLIKMTYETNLKDYPITIKLNDHVVTNLTKLCIMTDQVDNSNSYPCNTKIIDGGDRLYTKSDCYINLVSINQGELYSIFSKQCSDIIHKAASSNTTCISFNHDHIVIGITECDRRIDYNVKLYKLSGELVGAYSLFMSVNIKKVSQAIFSKSNYSNNIVFVGAPRMGEGSGDYCKIGILDCENGEVSVQISKNTVDLEDVNIALGDKIIYVIGRDADDPFKKIIKLFNYLGELVASHYFAEEIHSIFAKNDCVILATNKSIVVGNKDLNIIRCKVSIKCEYDIIKYDGDRVYALSNKKRILSSWTANSFMRTTI